MVSAESWRKLMWWKGIIVIIIINNNIENSDQNKNMGKCTKDAMNYGKWDTSLLDQQEKTRVVYIRPVAGNA